MYNYVHLVFISRKDSINVVKKKTFNALILKKNQSNNMLLILTRTCVKISLYVTSESWYFVMGDNANQEDR